MDVDALIASVYKRSPIWDKRDKLYANRTASDKLWKQVAQELNIDETLVRKKWKYLRDNFAVEFTKRTVPRSGDAADSSAPSKWKYYPQLMFLKDIVTPRSSSRSLKVFATLPGPSGSDSDDWEEGTVELETSQICVTPSVPSSGEPEVPSDPESQTQRYREDEMVPIQTPAMNTPSRKRKRVSDDYYKYMYSKHLEIEAPKAEYLNSKTPKSEPDDADLMFYKSLLPHVREIPMQLKLDYQQRVLELVKEFAYGATTSKITKNPASEREAGQAATSSR
ncbi:hypothetical protein EGW08_022991 [Elysia chlorotica]|uniref:MADF domain-containing protein n=1 Tax=Elysia chlorotica TaxID=188477 RepID=A0A433SJQ3_ELYCH|nr:hypothetical protein EGW08_022991 [Elysia chlorotica]